MPKNSSVSILRHIALAEGVSFLLLLLVAMPLKYFAGMPIAVKFAGWFHGGLFVALCFILVHVLLTTRWPFVRAVVVFIAALVPFGPFLIDKRMRAWESEAGA